MEGRYHEGRPWWAGTGWSWSGSRGAWVDLLRGAVGALPAPRKIEYLLSRGRARQPAGRYVEGKYAFDQGIRPRSSASRCSHRDRRLDGSPRRRASASPEPGTSRKQPCQVLAAPQGSNRWTPAHRISLYRPVSADLTSR